MTLARHQHATETPAESLTRREERAYILLEEARLRCERLQRLSGGNVQLRGLHRALGLAGFFASASLSSDQRRESLARSHERSAGTADERDHRLALEAVVEHARRAVESGLIAPGLSDHMHLAHLHVLEAQELLVTALASAEQSAATRSFPDGPLAQ